MFEVFCSMGAYEEPKETCGTICLKYLLFAFNFMFWVSLRSVGFGCFSSCSRAAMCFLRQVRPEAGDQEVRQWWRPGQSVNRWRRKKMRRNHLIFKQSKIGIIGWSLLLFWLVELQQSYTAKHSKAKSSELSSNEDAVFWECTTTNNCHIWMRRIKLLQARHDSECEITHLEIALCPYVIIICLPDNLMFETGKCCSVSAVPNTGVITMWIFYYWMDSDFPHALMPLYGKCLLGFSSEHFGATYEIIVSYQKNHMSGI